MLLFKYRRAIVEELAGLGAKVHTCARNENELENCLSDWNRSGLRVAGSVCDVSDRFQREDLIETVSSAFDGKIHILVRFNAHKVFVGLSVRTIVENKFLSCVILSLNFDAFR